MMKKYIVFSLVFLINIFCLSQQGIAQTKAPKVHQVYLEGGKILRGKINEENQESLKLKTKGKKAYWIDKTTIKDISEVPKFFYRKEGFIHQTMAGIGLGENKNSMSLHISSFHGYQLHPLFAIGLTTGFGKYDHVEGIIIPFALGIRGEVSKHALSPFYALDIGHSFHLMPKKQEPDTPWNTNEKYKGGFLLNPAIGIKFRTAHKTSFLWSVGYKIQHLTHSYTINDWWWGENTQVTQKRLFQHPEMKFGIHF